MEFQKGQMVDAKVIKVDNQRLELEFEGGKAYLPKQEMHVGKKKKLTEIFSEGYILTANVLSKKKDYYILTQKEIVVQEVVAKEEKKSSEKKNKKKSLAVQEKTNKKIKTPKVEEKKEEEKVKSLKLEDLKKLKTFGSMKISVQKKNSIQKLQEEKVEEKEEKILLDLPENFLGNLTQSHEETSKRFDELIKRLKEGGYLDET